MRILAEPGEPGVVCSRGYFPATLGAAVRQKARWLGGIAFAGWDRLGWGGGIGERWMRLRDRRGPLAALLIVAAYLAALLWSQVWLAKLLGAPVEVRIDPALATLLTINAWLLAWRVLMRAAFTASAYGLEEACFRCLDCSSETSSRCLPHSVHFPSTPADGLRAGTRPSTFSPRRPCNERACPFPVRCDRWLGPVQPRRVCSPASRPSPSPRPRGYQPGLYRVDAGPRISMRVRPNVSLHFDWRQRLAGAAEPGSGPAVTLGANF